MAVNTPLSDTGRTWRDWVGLAARIILGLTLVVSGALKLPYLEASVQNVRAFKILPFEITAPIGYALPVVELAIGLLLLTGTFTRITAVLGTLLMLAFTIGIISVWARGISIDCGCFGGGGAVDPTQTQYPLDIARDLGLMACGVWLALRPTTPFSVDNWLFRPVDDAELMQDLSDDEAEADQLEPTQEPVR